MKSFIKEFCKRGLLAFGFGPVVMAIVYLCLPLFGIDDELSLTQVGIQTILVSLMAFLAAGITAVYQVERLPLPYAIIIQATVLYVDYIVVYLVNGWLKKSFLPIIIFTAIFIVSYAIIWALVYAFSRRSARRLNEKLKNE